MTDPTGAAIANATISLTKIDTGAETVLATNEVGLYYGRSLNPGLYEIQVEFAGFKTFRVTGIELRTGANLEYPITLEVGAVTETIEVTAEATADIQTASGERQFGRRQPGDQRDAGFHPQGDGTHDGYSGCDDDDKRAYWLFIHAFLQHRRKCHHPG